MIKALGGIWNAMKRGEEFRDAVKAKNWTVAITAAKAFIIIAVATARAVKPELFGGITDAQIELFLGGLVVSGGAVIGMFRVGSSPERGLGGATAPADVTDGWVAKLDGNSSREFRGVAPSFDADKTRHAEPVNTPKVPVEPWRKNVEPTDPNNNGGGA